MTNLERKSEYGHPFWHAGSWVWDEQRDECSAVRHGEFCNWTRAEAGRHRTLWIRDDRRATDNQRAARKAVQS